VLTCHNSLLIGPNGTGCASCYKLRRTYFECFHGNLSQIHKQLLSAVKKRWYEGVSFIRSFIHNKRLCTTDQYRVISFVAWKRQTEAFKFILHSKTS